MAKKKKKEEQRLEAPIRPADHVSKRGIPYWWSPEWCRDLNGSICKIKAIKNKKGDVDLFMKSKNGNTTFIQGSIQEEFKRWHTDREIDYILLGEDPDTLLE
jgi:hypothetical protein